MGSLDELLGPMLLGLTLNTLLMGGLIVQYYMYWSAGYKRDPLGVKLLVCFLMLADSVNLVFDLTFVWLYTVTHFGDFHYITMSNWVFNTDPVMTVIISSTVQSFFAWRVKKLTGKTWLFVLLNISAIIQFLTGLGTTIACAIVKDFANFQRFSSVVIVWLGLSALTDVVIAVTMVQYLRGHRTGIAQTEDILTKLIKFTIQTGMITSICAVVDLIVYLSLANNLHLIFNMALSKLYSGACLSSLNARTAWTVDSNPGQGTGTLDYASRSPPGGINILTTATVHLDSFEMDDNHVTTYGQNMRHGRRTSRAGITGVPSSTSHAAHHGAFGLDTISTVAGEKNGGVDAFASEKSVTEVDDLSPRTMVSLDMSRSRTRTGSDADDEKRKYSHNMA